MDVLCHLCGKPIPPDQLHVDHVLPRSRGGSDVAGNKLPAHDVCNLSKGTGDAPTWMRSWSETIERGGSHSYDLAIGIRHYARAVAAGEGNPFVLLSETIDGGELLRSADAGLVRDLAAHGAYLTDARGNILETGRGAVYVIWPHVAMRSPKWNGGIDTKLDRPTAKKRWKFVMTNKGTDESRRAMIRAAARDLLQSTAASAAR